MKYTWIKDYSAHYPIARLCRLCGVSRTGSMQWKTRPMSRTAVSNVVLDRQVLQLHMDSGRSYGRPRLLRALNAQGIQAGQELATSTTTPRLQAAVSGDDGFQSCQTSSTHVLNRQFDGWPPNRARVSDITYVPTAEGWLYLACMLDLGSRRIAGWSMNTRMSSELVCKSMSRKANCRDNAPMESFFKSLKVECAYRLKSQTRDMVRLHLVDWTEDFYNARRLHSAPDYQAPNEYERSLTAD